MQSSVSIRISFEDHVASVFLFICHKNPSIALFKKVALDSWSLFRDLRMPYKYPIACLNWVWSSAAVFCAPCKPYKYLAFLKNWSANSWSAFSCFWVPYALWIHQNLSRGFLRITVPLVSYIRNSLRLWYYASISTCCQNLEKNGATEKIFRGVKLLRDLTEKSVNFSTLATSSIRLLLVFGEEDQ